MTIARIPTALGNSMATLVRDAIDGGSGPGLIKVYAGAIPNTPETAISGQTLLGTATCSDPCGTVADKTLTFSAVTQDAAADATADATFARVCDSDGNVQLDVDITDTGGIGTLKLNTIHIVTGGPLAINSFSVQIG